MNDRKKYILGALICAIVAIGLSLDRLPDGLLHVWALDVGQGDAILLKTPEGANILIDGGPDDTVLRRLSEHIDNNEREIDMIVLTHPHPDHINGLIEVIKNYKVHNILMTGVEYGLPAYGYFLSLISGKDIKIFFAASNTDFKTGKTFIDVVYPLKSIQNRHFENYNNSSIVLRITYGDTSFLFMGDLEEQGENGLIESGAFLVADILKVGHHGSKTATSKDLLDAVKPHTAIVSCGKDNKFKHPHQVVMDRLTEASVDVLRTDLIGSIEITSDGRKIYKKM